MHGQENIKIQGEVIALWTIRTSFTRLNKRDKYLEKKNICIYIIIINLVLRFDVEIRRLHKLSAYLQALTLSAM